MPRSALTPAGLVAVRERMTQGMAERTLRKPLYFGGAMLAAGDAAAMVAGGVANPTRRVIEAGLMTVGLAPGIATPSSFFLMILPALAQRLRASPIAPSTPTRTPEQLADIAIASADSARSLLGRRAARRPAVVLDARQRQPSARRQGARGARTSCAAAGLSSPIDGELQGDAALSRAPLRPRR